MQSLPMPMLIVAGLGALLPIAAAMRPRLGGARLPSSVCFLRGDEPGPSLPPSTLRSARGESGAPPAPPDPFDGAEAERELVARLRAGDAGAHETMVRVHAARLTATAQRILRNEDDARDAVQDAFLSAFRALPRFHGDARLSTWLHRIVVNTALMKLRGRKRRAEEPIEALLPVFLDDGHAAVPAVEWRPSCHEELEREERCALVRDCIERLPDSYRTVLLLRDIEELDTAETAALLGITDNAVKIRLHRARQALRTLLDPHFRPERGR